MVNEFREQEKDLLISTGIFKRPLNQLFLDLKIYIYKIVPEQKARTTYDNILRFCDDYDVKDAIRFLRAREVVHYQRFGENLRLLTDKLNSKNFYAFNPEFDKKCFKNELKKKI